MQRRHQKEMIVMAAAIITGTSGKPAASAVEMATRICEEVDTRWPDCPVCDEPMEPHQECQRCARQRELNPTE